MRSAASRALRLACQRLEVGPLGQPGVAWRLPSMAATPSGSARRPFACNAGLGRPPPPEVVITYGSDRLEDFLAAADELEDRFPGLVVTGVEGVGAPPTAFEVAPPRPARPGGEEGEGDGAASATMGGPTLWSGLALGRPPAPGEVAALLAAAGVGGSPQNPADGLGCGG